jgi:hypothetical protein
LSAGRAALPSIRLPVAFAVERNYPESDHAPVVAFDLR